MIKIIKKLVFSGLKLVVFTLWKLKLDYIISKLFGMFIILFNKNEIVKDEKKTVILAMDRKIFHDDVKALREYPSNYKILIYPVLLRALISDESRDLLPLWPKELKEQTSFYSKKEKYKDFYERLSKIFYETLSFLASFTQLEAKIILTANFDYYQDYPWIKAIQDNHGKFIVLEKESILYIPKTEERLHSRYKKYKFKYEGDAVLFYNKKAKEIYIKTGCVKSNQAFATGCPRVDRLTVLSKNTNSKSNFALFVTFMDPIHGAAKSVELGYEILNAIYIDEMLKRKTIVKCKDSIEARAIEKKFPGISTAIGPMEKYLKRKPSLLVGFNSTSCLDALITGIPVLIPWWGDARELGKDALLGDHTNDFHLIALNKNSLIKILKDQLSNDRQIRTNTQTVWNNLNLKKLVEENYSLVDGRNCQRFFSVLDNLLV